MDHATRESIVTSSTITLQYLDFVIKFCPLR